MSYEIWDTETGNLVEAFDSETDAVSAARELIGLNADVYPALLTLLAVDERGGLTTVAAGDDLGALVSSTLDGEARHSR